MPADRRSTPYCNAADCTKKAINGTSKCQTHTVRYCDVDQCYQQAVDDSDQCEDHQEDEDDEDEDDDEDDEDDESEYQGPAGAATGGKRETRSTAECSVTTCNNKVKEGCSKCESCSPKYT